jgi:hypothetical protein
VPHVPHISKHAFTRHFAKSSTDNFCPASASGRVELNVIKSWSGHVSITTTSQYVEIDMAMKRKAIERCQPPVPTLEGESRWHARQDIIQWLEDLSAPKSYVKQNPRRPTPSDQTAAPAPAQFHIISGFT